MKKTLIYIGAAVLAVSLPAACSDDYDKYDNSYILDNDETMTLTASTDYIELNELTPSEDPVLTFTWTDARQMPEEYTLSYITEIDLQSNDFNSSSKVRFEENEGVYSRSFTTEQLQNWITDKWGQSVNFETVISFRVIAKWDGGTKYAMPEVRTADITIRPYKPLVFDADKVFLEGVTTGISYQPIGKTVENQYIYAEYDGFNAGSLGIRVQYDEAYQYIAPAEGHTGKFQDGIAVPARMVEPAEGSTETKPLLPEIAKWEFPKAGKYRVVVDLEEKQVTIYGPDNEFNEPFVVEGWYPADNEENPVQTTVVTNLFFRGACVGWNEGSKGAEPLDMHLTQSLADPKILVYSGAAFNGRSDFAIKNYDPDLILENGSKFTTNNSVIVAPPTDTPGALEDKDDTDGDGIKGGAQVVLGTPMEFVVGGGEIRNSYWAVPNGTNYVIFNFRNKTVTFMSK